MESCRIGRSPVGFLVGCGSSLPLMQTLAIGADHGGFELKQQLAEHIRSRGFAVEDCGTHSTEAVDYPKIAAEVAGRVAEGRARFGVIIDGAGIGSAMTANKFPGVRAALCYDLSSARNSREHNNANVLTLGSGADRRRPREADCRRVFRYRMHGRPAPPPGGDDRRNRKPIAQDWRLRLQHEERGRRRNHASTGKPGSEQRATTEAALTELSETDLQASRGSHFADAGHRCRRRRR